MISLLRGWLGWALGAIALGAAVVAAIWTTGDFPGLKTQTPEEPAEVAAAPEPADEKPAAEPEKAVEDAAMPAEEVEPAQAPSDAGQDTQTPDTPATDTQDKQMAETPAEPDPAQTDTAAADGAPAPQPSDDKAAGEDTAQNEGPAAAENADASSDTTADPQDAPDAAAVIAPPEFDVVRISPEGSAVIAGHAAPGSTVSILVAGKELAQAVADATGNFVAIFDLPRAEVPRVMQLSALMDGGAILSDKSVIVEPRQAPVAMADAGQASAAEPTPPVNKPDREEAAQAAPADAQRAAGEAERAATPTVEPSGVPTEQTAEIGSPEPAAPSEDKEAAPAPETTAIADADGGPESRPIMETAPSAPEATEAVSEPAPAQAPRVLLADREGITVMDDPSAPDMPDLSLDAIAYDDQGEVSISGRGHAGSSVRLYLDNALVGDVQVGETGQWRLTLPQSVEPGIYTLRVDELGPDGTVTARVESPFKREDREMLMAALGEAAQAAQAPEEATEASGAPDTMAATDEAGTTAEPTATTPETDATDDEDAGAMVAADAREPAPAATDAPEASETAMADSPNVPPAGQDSAEVAAMGEAPAGDTAPAMQAETAPPAAPGPEPMISAITVQPGSTLWAISRERYGDGLLYVQVFEANRDKIRDPDLIYPGQVFTLPEDVGDK